MNKRHMGSLGIMGVLAPTLLLVGLASSASAVASLW